MKKIISVTLILSIIVGLMASCQKTTDVASDKVYPRIVVIKEPSSDILQYYYGLFGKDYDTYQEALNDLVDKYNKTHDNDILLNICIALIRDDYIKDSVELKMEYNSEFFNQVWTDKKFNKKTKEYQKDIALNFISCLYWNVKKTESISFYDKYVAALEDKNEIISFCSLYSSFYENDKNANHDNLIAMYDRVKKLEEDYYNEADTMNKIRIVGMVSNFAELLNDKETADKYNKKLIELIDNMRKESN